MNQLAKRNQQQSASQQIQLSGAKEKLQQMFIQAGIETILPSHISMDQFVQVAAIAYLKEPKLQQATQETVMMAFAECAKDGLIPNGKEAYINCYNRNFGTKQNPNYMMVAEYQPMIEGVLKRARNSGDVEFIDVGVVYQEEEFEHWTGIEGKHFKHVPRYDIDRSMDRIHLFYGIAKLKSGEIKVEVMSRADVDKVREVSHAKNASTWVTWYDRMGLKAVGHRLCRQLPKGSELVAMLEKGDEKDFNTEIEINPVQGPKAIAKPKQATTSVDSLMGSAELEPTAITQQSNDKPTGVNDLMGGQSMPDNNVCGTLEDLIMGIGSTGDQKETIAEYKHAVKEVKSAFANEEINEEQHANFNAQLTSIHAAINGNIRG
ncbi:recombinase RecT [Vibrio parahaemolyticus]|nr:recombinase RecT [Vibrio parahaemolyticus]